ncbi:ATP-dependent protease ClpP, protease subunit [Marinobacter sp. LV10R510-11A]|uniref:head maturation protease, ClpP-related n=1 Tax=Marinobacter sp. LV10R510-11A TaxID=1415568 RepID=UPI000BB8A7A5|nr:head maturation protease, ClpP-related [Marinobacter sp. LV10R510-11A]SOB76182.1 ATP-dependent protease ClpP, protease subunit [Marinobacter sp. LV10R510-11A]
MQWFKAQASGDRTAKVIIDRAIGSDWAPDWISDFTGEKPAREFIEAVEALGELDRIDLEINSPGGDVASGVRIMNYLKSHNAEVHVKVTGMAASIATIIMLAGDTRTMGIGTSVMTHRASTLMVGFYSAKEMEEHSKGIGAIDASLVEAYVAGTGKTADEINALLDRGDVYMGADEAIEWGLATHKDAKLKAVASADPAQFKQQLEMQGQIRAAKAEAEAATALVTIKDEAITALGSQIDDITSQLEALRNPTAATADQVIDLCATAGLESLAVAMSKEKLPIATVEARIRMAKDVEDIAKASGVDSEIMLKHLNDPTQMIRSAIAEAKALADKDLDHHHAPGPGNSKQPDFKKAYSQLNNQA